MATMATNNAGLKELGSARCDAAGSARDTCHLIDNAGSTCDIAGIHCDTAPRNHGYHGYGHGSNHALALKSGIHRVRAWPHLEGRQLASYGTEQQSHNVHSHSGGVGTAFLTSSESEKVTLRYVLGHSRDRVDARQT